MEVVVITYIKYELLPIENSIMRLANPKSSMKKKDKYYRNQRLEKGVFTANASFVIPTLLSILTKNQRK